MPHYIQFARSGIVEGFSNTSEFQTDFSFIDFNPLMFQEVWDNPKPALEQETGFIFFPPSQTRAISGYFAMPSSITDGGKWTTAVRYVKTTDEPGEIAWRLRGRAIFLGDSINVELRDFGVADSSPFYHENTTDLYCEDAWPEIEYTEEEGKKPIGATIVYKLSRDVDHDRDTYPDIVKMITLGAYCEIDTLGSELKYEK